LSTNIDKSQNVATFQTAPSTNNRFNAFCATIEDDESDPIIAEPTTSGFDEDFNDTTNSGGEDGNSEKEFTDHQNLPTLT